MPRNVNFGLYKKALEAGARFRRELERVYGKRRASAARFRFHHQDARVEAAARAKVRADQRWLAEMRKTQW